MTHRALDNVVQILRDRLSEPVRTMQDVRRCFERLADDLPDPDVPATYDRLDADGVPAVWVSTPGADHDQVVLFLHGGGYCSGSTHVYADFMARLSHACGTRVLGIDYRLAPEHRFPAAVDDTLTAYRWLVRRCDPARITLAGDSAGGGLTLATLLALRDAARPLPARAVCVSPWTDLEGSGPSVRTRADIDPWLSSERIATSASRYVEGEDIRNPLAAPLHGDPSGLPPLLILVGDAETLLDDSTRFAAKARAAGVDVTLEIWDDMIHVWPFFAGLLPEGMRAFERIGRFVREAAPG